MPDAQPSLPVLIFYIDSTTQKGLFELVNHNSPSAIEHDIFPLTTYSLKNTIHTVWSDAKVLNPSPPSGGLFPRPQRGVSIKSPLW